MFDFLAGIIVFGGAVFWGLIGLLTIWLFITVGKAMPFWSVVPLAAIIFIVGWVAADSPVPDWGWKQWGVVITAYLSVGIIYAVAAWYRKLRQIKAYIYEKPQRLKDVQKDKVLTHADFGQDRGANIPIPPRPSYFSRTIMTWLAYWPLSFVAYLVGDWLYDFFKGIYDWLSGLLMRMSNRVFDDFEPNHD